MAIEEVDRHVTAATAAAQATVIHTNTEGITTERVTIDVSGFPVPAYVARPDSAGELPTMLLIGESFGLHPYIEDVTRRLSNA
ncbi:dienelactone hydrolase family protein [Jatrophihabitans lederbergiae]|uniref:Alpha/beta hydrolase n=1 Tax=Jatrophihabitans lederbergiae TaxID=3075547 RepID=A0ABU2J7R5_9ACTN|nr:hypothetical protein [Jatrophihabitans sp. DSM 44399]MDT0261026.1 hypothetical protein [Jatrophihabitans sp. DSM 44399]